MWWRVFFAKTQESFFNFRCTLPFMTFKVNLEKLDAQIKYIGFNMGDSRYVKRFKYLEGLRNCIHDQNLIESLDKIHDAMETIWNPNERLIKNFTDHGVEHSDRIARNILCLLETDKEIDKTRLSEWEAYLLLASIYLHDIGMQCDVSNFSDVVYKAEKIYHSATDNEDQCFKIGYTARDSSDFDYYEQSEIRKNHSILTAAWIEILRKEDGNSVLHKAAKSIPDNCIEDIKDICMYHSKLPLTLETFGTNKHKLLLAALLRFGDELDIAKDRVSPDMYETFRVATENSKHWWLHQHTEIDREKLKKGQVILTYYLNPDDEKHSDIIKDYYYFNFEDKNKELKKILNDCGVNIHIEPAIIEKDNRCPKMDPKLVEELNEFKYKPNPSSIESRIGPIRHKSEMRRYPKKRDAPNENQDGSPIYAITFDVPNNWIIHSTNEDDNNENMKLLLKHGSSSIEINVIKIKGHGIPQILTRKFLKTDWENCYNNGFSWSVNTDIGDHYIDYIIHRNDFWTGRLSVGTGISRIDHDIKSPYYGIKYNGGMPNEWVIAWTNPRYKDRIIAIHAKFREKYVKNDYEGEVVNLGGGTNDPIKMQSPLYTILKNFKMGEYS
jgi:hypothetical protein